ncbi:hypothetical protein V6R21_27615 [Limibacter armeniacum]|uniref:hypothetical protein n=1 Tax=Limibacter armeniacum TaxID=466084 RepID=UPI002FE66C03
MMDHQFSSEQKILIKDISSIMFDSVANSLGKMFGDEVFVRKVNCFEEAEVALKAKENVEDQHLLMMTTEVIGDLQAGTYLVLEPEYKQKLCSHLLPASVVGQLEMWEAVLLEMDNIAIAAMVTKLANILDVEIFGHVPEYAEDTCKNIVRVINEHKEEINPCYAVEGEFYSFKLQVPMKVLCYFGQDFIPQIENFDLEKAYVGKKEKKEGGLFKRIFG